MQLSHTVSGTVTMSQSLQIFSHHLSGKEYHEKVHTISQESPISQTTHLSLILLTSLCFLRYLNVGGLDFIR